jgi:hypothetical protein
MLRTGFWRQSIVIHASPVLPPQHAQAWRLFGAASLHAGDNILVRKRLERAICIDADDAAGRGAPGNVPRASEVSLTDPTLDVACVALRRVSVALGRPAQTFVVGEAAVIRRAAGSIKVRAAWREGFASRRAKRNW